MLVVHAPEAFNIDTSALFVWLGDRPLVSSV